MHTANRRVAVFGASQAREGAPTFEEAVRLGGRLAREGWTVVTGGYSGLMAAASKGARDAGGAVVGVTLRSFDPKQPNPWLSERVHENDLHERIRHLICNSDAVVVLDGGLGTLAEFGMAWVMKQVGLLPRGLPIVVVGESFKELCRDVAVRLDLSPGDVDLVHPARDTDDVIERLKGAFAVADRLRTPPISIVMAAYNAGPFIEEAIRSALAQTVPPEKIVVVDDGSTDDTVRIVTGMQEIAGSVCLLTQPNAGTPAALNAGIRMCGTEYVLGLDADDVLEVHAVERMWAAARLHPESVMVYSDYRFIDGNGVVTRSVRNPGPEGATSRLMQLHNRLDLHGEDNFLPYGHARLYRRKDLLELGGYSVDILYSEDFDMVLRLAERGAFSHVPEYLYRYRWHGTNKGITHREGQLSDVRESVRRHLWRMARR